MRRADRLFQIVQILRRARKPISAATIAAEIEVSARTVYRDIAALIAQRVPVVGEAGVGYVLADGFDMPALMLSAEELDAAVLGAHWVASRGDAALARAAQDLIAKIAAVVPAHLHPHLFEPATSIAPLAAPVREAVEPAEMRIAIRRGRKMAITYRDPAGTVTDRVVWPVLLGYRDAGRILAAWCELRTAFRYFRTERMLSARLLEQRVPDRPAALKARWREAMAVERARYAAANE